MTQALYREKKKMKGEAAGVQPKTASDIMENLDMKYQTTSTNMEFLRYMEYTDASESKIMMVFCSDTGKHILENSEEWFCDGTFSTSPPNFAQIFFVMGKIGNKKPIVALFALLLD